MNVHFAGRFSFLTAFCGALLLWLGAIAATGATLEVGPGKPFERIETAVARANPGDIINVYPLPSGRAYERVGVWVNTPGLTIRAAGVGAGQRVTLSGEGFEHSGRGRTPRAIFQFNRGADHSVLEGFELTGASNRSNNGAGVRINQANHVVIRNCDIHHNQMGIMSNGDSGASTAVNQLIEYSSIHHNGNAASPTFHHNLYVGGTSVTLRFSEVSHSRRGHNIKSRAQFTRVESSYVHDSSNREFDLVDTAGTQVVLLGNIIVKDPQSSGNRGVIHFSQAGTLYLVHNTVVTPFISPVVQLSGAGAKAVLLGNIVDDGGSRRNNQRLGGARRGGASTTNISGQGNWFAPGFAARLQETSLTTSGNTVASRSRNLYLDPQQHDYRLREAWPGIVRAGRPPHALNLPLTPGVLDEDIPPRWQYVHPLGREPRVFSDLPDLGAQAYDQP